MAKHFRTLPGEEWRLISGTDDYYISNKGRFRRGNSLRKVTLDMEGYARCNIGTKKCRVHRLVAEAFIPNPDNLPVVDHLDADKANNNVENLRWCTQQDNTQAAKDMGLGNNMRRTMVLVLDNDDNGQLYATQTDAANATGVNRKAVNKVVLGKEKSRGGYRFIRLQSFEDMR